MMTTTTNLLPPGFFEEMDHYLEETAAEGEIQPTHMLTEEMASWPEYPFNDMCADDTWDNNPIPPPPTVIAPQTFSIFSAKARVSSREENGLETSMVEAEAIASTSSARRSRSAEAHNLSEKRRRGRINSKMTELGDLVPNCNKTDKVSVLADAIEHIKSLEMRVSVLADAIEHIKRLEMRVNLLRDHMPECNRTNSVSVLDDAIEHMKSLDMKVNLLGDHIPKCNKTDNLSVLDDVIEHMKSLDMRVNLLGDHIPICNKTDNLSVLDDVIEHMKSLDMKLKELNRRIARQNNTPQYIPGMGMPMSQLPMLPYKSKSNPDYMVPRFPIMPTTYHTTQASNQADSSVNYNQYQNQPGMANFDDMNQYQNQPGMTNLDDLNQYQNQPGIAPNLVGQNNQYQNQQQMTYLADLAQYQNQPQMANPFYPSYQHEFVGMEPTQFQIPKNQEGTQPCVNDPSTSTRVLPPEENVIIIN